MAASRLRSIVGALLLVVLAGGCTGTPARDEQATLSVFAASSLTDVMSEVTATFERTHPDIDLQVTFAGSQVLRLQIEQGASVDVFASANDAHMDALEDGGYVLRSRPLATTDLVVIVPRDNPAGIERFDQLARAERIVVGTRFVPIGAYTDAVLDNASVALGDDFAAGVRNRIASMESNVRLVRAKVELGEADAAVVYTTDALHSDRVRIVPIPDEFNVQARFRIAVTSETRRAPEAERLLDFLSSPPAREIFRAHGFTGAG